MLVRHRLFVSVLSASLVLAAGCKTAPLPSGVKAAASAAPGASHKDDLTPAPTATKSDNGALHTYFGRVLDPTGQPLTGIPIKAYLVANNSGSLVSDDGAGLITDMGSGVVANNGGSVVANNGSNAVGANAGSQATAHSLHLLAADPTVTDAKGEFKLDIPEGDTFNLEAAKDNDLKALLQGVTNKSTGLELKLAPPGTLHGSVSFPDDPNVKDFTGADVFIPGSSYTAKTATDGSFTIANVPPGTYSLYATKRGLGGGHADGAKVTSKVTTDAGNLPLKLLPLVITGVSPNNAAAGSTVAVKGNNFGADQGLPFQVRLGGAVLESAKRTSEHDLSFTVPPNATSGDLVVEVDSHASKAVPFQVIQEFTVLAPRTLVVGSSTPMLVSALDDKQGAVTIPQIQWAQTSGGVSIDAKGVVSATTPGVAYVTGTSGGLQAKVKLTVVAKGGTGTAGGKTEPIVRGLRDIAIDPIKKLLYLASADNVVTFDPATSVATLLAGANLTAPDTIGPDVNGKGVQAVFNGITGLAYNAKSNNLLVLESNAIRTLGLDGSADTLVSADNMPITGGTSVIVEYHDGTVDQATLLQAQDCALAADGSFFFSDTQSLRRMSNGAVQTLAGTKQVLTLDGMFWLDPATNVVWTLDLGRSQLTPFNGGTAIPIKGLTPAFTIYRTLFDLASTGTPTATTSSNRFTGVAQWGGMVGDGRGNFYLSGDGNFFKIAADGTLTVLVAAEQGATVDGDGATARFSAPGRLVLAADGSIYMAEDGALRKIALTDSTHVNVTTLLQGAGSLNRTRAVKK